MSIVYLPHVPASVSVARRHLTRELLAWGVSDDVADDAAVIASELLSNALRHARPLAGDNIKVSWTRVGDTVEVAVTDGGAVTEPRKGQPALSSLGGRGLGIVEVLAQSWGVRREENASTVWALLHAPAKVSASGREQLVNESGTPMRNLG